jgi:hypothetical protein
MTHNHVPGIGMVCPMQTIVGEEVINSANNRRARPKPFDGGQGDRRTCIHPYSEPPQVRRSF